MKQKHTWGIVGAVIGFLFGTMTSTGKKLAGRV